MLKTRLLALTAAGSLLAGTASAQFCSDNLWPVHIVDAAGNELATEFDPEIGEDVFLVPTEKVYLAFDPNLASGTYYVHVTDAPIDGMDEVLSLNDPMDRFVHVENDNGVITLSLPYSPNPGAAVFGTGLGGVGQSLCITPLSPSPFAPCRYKAWYGDNWDLSFGPENPYLLAGGENPNGSCVVRSYHAFRIGDGSGSDVTGCVFLDDDRDGMRDANEAGAPNQEVRLLADGVQLTAITDAEGKYRFDDVGKDDWTVELVVPAGYIATTASSQILSACACAPVEADDFGIAQEMTACSARTIGFWRNRHGRALVEQYGILALLPNLCIVNTCGSYVAPANLRQYRRWLRRANAWNMAYMLSAQLVAMHNNVLVGFVDGNCVVDDPCLGTITIAELMQQSVASLCDHPYTPPWSCYRQHQRRLKDALDRANNNETWQ